MNPHDLAAVDELSWQVFARHAPGEPLPRPDAGGFRDAATALVGRWLVAGRNDALRALFAELHATLVPLFDARPESADVWDTAEGQLHRFFSDDGFHALLDLRPPESPRYQRYLDRMQAEDDRRRQDESGY